MRKYSIDELPQLFNILWGSMTLIGPRPPVPSEVEEYKDSHHRRLSMKPGITGLAQVNGNIHLSWPERWRLDARYVDQLSLWVDLGILLKTVAVVLLGEERFKA